MEIASSTIEIPVSDTIVLTDSPVLPESSSNDNPIADEPHANPIPNEVRANLINSISLANQPPQTTRTRSLPQQLFRSLRKLLMCLARCIFVKRLTFVVVSQVIVMALWGLGLIPIQNAFWLDVSFLLLAMLLICYRLYRISRRLRIIAAREREPAPPVQVSSLNRRGIRSRTRDLMRALIIQQIQINQARMLLNSLNQDNRENEGIPLRGRIRYESGLTEIFLSRIAARIQSQNQNLGLDAEQIESVMPEVAYEVQEGADESSQTCTICLEDFVGGHQVRRAPCQHFFHKQCIDGWLSIRNNCPNCKLEIRSQNSQANGGNPQQNMGVGSQLQPPQPSGDSIKYRYSVKCRK